MAVKVGMVSLGCAKNLVNGEQMLHLLRTSGYEITADLAETEVLIVNTCAFIDSAKQEAIDTILEFAELKKEGRLKKLLVAGCLSQRYRKEILKELPEVDGILGTGSYDEIVPIDRIGKVPAARADALCTFEAAGVIGRDLARFQAQGHLGAVEITVRLDDADHLRAPHMSFDLLYVVVESRHVDLGPDLS